MSDRFEDPDNNNNDNNKPHDKRRNAINFGKKQPAFTKDYVAAKLQQQQMDEQRGRHHQRQQAMGNHRTPQQIALNTTPTSSPLDPQVRNEIGDTFGVPKVDVPVVPQPETPTQPEQKPEKKLRRGTFGQLSLDN